MKTSASCLIAAGVLGICTGCFAQAAASAVIDEALISTTNANHNALMSLLQKQLEEAQKQNEKLQSQLDRMGDPAAVTLPALELIKQDLAKANANAQSAADRDARLRGVTGTEAFGENSFGLAPAVEATYELEDGTSKERDPEKYKAEALLRGEINEYERKSKAAEERKVELTQAKADALQTMLEATDMATVLKQSALMAALDGQIAAVDAASLKDKADFDMVRERLQVDRAIANKAKQEETAGQRTADKSDTASHDATKEELKKAFRNPGKLPWGKKAATP